MNLIGIFSGIIFFITLVYFHYKNSQDRLIIEFYFPALTLKITAGIGIGLVYNFYYGHGDTLMFHLDAIRVTELFWKNPTDYLRLLLIDHSFYEQNLVFAGQPRSILLVKILSIVHIITGNNYWISSLFFSFFSFVGFWYFTTGLLKYYEIKKIPVILSFLVFPSVVWWSSGITKESIALGCLAFVAGVFIKWYKTDKISLSQLAILVLFSILLFKIKYYYASIFLPVLISLAFIKKLSVWSEFFKVAWIQTAFWIVFLSLLFFASTFLHPNLSFSIIPEVIVNNYHNFEKLSDKNNLIHFNNLHPEWSSILINFPWAVLSGIFRPLLFEEGNILKNLAVIENVILLFFALISLKNINLIFKSKERLLLTGLVLYIILLAGFLALSAPNFGTLVRYKVGFLPFLLLLIFVKNPLVRRLK